MAVPGLRGVEIPSSVGGRYLGDDFFLPFWEAAAATGAVVFIHPSTRGFGIPALDGYYLWNSVGNPLETAVTAAHIAVAGVLERFPGLRILLAHGGGALPVLRGRLRRAHAVRPEAAERLSQGPDVSLRRFHYDTVTHDAGLLADLVQYAGPEQVLLGSDRPFDMGTDDPVGEVRALRLGPGEDLILGGNAGAACRGRPVTEPGLGPVACVSRRAEDLRVRSRPSAAAPGVMTYPEDRHGLHQGGSQAGRPGLLHRAVGRDHHAVRPQRRAGR